MVIVGIAFIVLGVDQIVKYLISAFFVSHPTAVEVIPSVFYLAYVRNTGIAFGLFRDHTTLLMIAIVGSIIALMIYVITTDDKKWYHRLAYGFIFGGAFGNIVDRIYRGYVVDFLDFRICPVFNCADACISVGVGILILDMLINNKTRKNHE